MKFKLPKIRRSKKEVSLADLRFKAEPLVAAFQGEVLDKYVVDQAMVFIVNHEGKGLYVVGEPKLTPEEQRIYSLLMENLYFTLKPVAKIENPMKYVESFIWEAAEELGIVEAVQKSFKKYRYYITRDAFGYGPIHVPMSDPGVEEVSNTGYGRPVTVIHRRFTEYDWLETNMVFPSEDELQNFVQRLSQRVGKSVTTAIPFADAMSRDGHRLAVTFAGEVTLPGSTFDVRKFPQNPLSMAHILKSGTLTPLIAAYLWLLTEYKGYIMILGPMSSGKSVAGNEPTIAVVNGVPVHATFNDLWSTVPSEVVDNGREISLKNPGGMTVPSLSSNHCEWVEPNFFIRHQFRGEGARIILRDGREVVVTWNHSLVVLDSRGEIIVKTPRNLKKGDMLPAPAKNSLPESEPTLEEVLRFFADDPRLFIRTQTLSEILHHLHGKLHSWKGVASLMGLKSPSRLGQRKIPLRGAVKAWREAGFPAKIAVCDRLGSCEFDLLETVLNPQFAKLLGYYIADGYLDRGKCTISVQNRERLQDIIESAESLGFKPYVFKPKRRVPKVILSVAPSAVIEALGCGRDAGLKSLPKIYWRMPKEWKAQFLRAYFGSDGGVEGHGSVHMTTKSFNLSRQLMIALLEFGICVQRRVKEVKGTDYYEIVIPSYFAEEFAENIGFTQTAKSLKLEAAMKRKKQVCSHFHVVPNCLLRKNMDEVRELAKNYKLFDKNVLDGYAASKKNLLKRLRLADPERKLKNLWTLAESEVLWMPVKRVEETRIEGHVYDFSTPSETFLAGDGIIVHNTTLLNCLLTMIDPTLKLATIEDTPEVIVPHLSW